MKRLMKYMAAAAAAMIMTAGVVSAQSLMKAEIPFAFSAGGKVVEPGTYLVGVLSGLNSNRVLHVVNTDTRRGHLLLSRSHGDAPARWIAGRVPKLGFDCTTGACILSQVWFGYGNAYQFYGPKTRGGEMLLAEIVMIPDRVN